MCSWSSLAESLLAFGWWWLALCPPPLRLIVCLVCATTEERDDLKSLLQATLQRLESVDEVLHRADVSTAMMEEKVRPISACLDLCHL